MTELRIATTGPEGFRRLGLHGQTVVEMHRQIATILNNRLGVQHARYFARPQIDPSTGRIDWHGTGTGPAAQPAGLPAEERERAETLSRQLAAEITQLAGRLKAEGASSEFVGRMLELALVTPAGADCLHVIGGQPVLILWGHEPVGTATPADTTPPQPRTPPAAHTAASQAAAPQAAPALAATGPAAPPPAGWAGRLAWGVPLVLLGVLAVLAVKALEPLPPVTIPVPEPAAPAANPIPALESREKELHDRLALLDRQRADALAQCRPAEPLQKAEIRPQPEPPAPPPAAPPTPAPKDDAPAVTETKPAPPPPSLSSIIGAIPEENKTPPKPAPPAHAQAAPGGAPGKTPAAPSCTTTYPPGQEPEVVLIVDGSGSMNEPFHDSTKIAMARRSITNLANSLPPPVSIGLIDFTGCSNVVRHDFYDAGRRGELIRKVQGLSPSGGTPLARSIERAGNVVSGVAPATIIVVSDGKDTCSGDPCAAARSVKAHKPNITINVVDISGGKEGDVLQCIAAATGGRVLSPQSGADMINKMQQATRLPDVRNCK